jgi:hypothetical protein
MQNHGPFSGEMENLPDEVKVLNDELNMDGVENYLNLIHESDKALKELVTYFENVDEPTVIVMFGDHQPGVGNKFYKKLAGGSKNTLEGEELMNLYHTKFLIWANYDIEGEKKLNISPGFLGNLTLKTAGIDLKGYRAFLDEQYADTPVVSAIHTLYADGTDADADANDPVLRKYRQYQYYEMFDDDDTLK